MQKVDLHGKTVLVTGSTDGVGRLVAMELGAAGAHVIVHGRNAARGKDVVTQIKRRHGSAVFEAADFSSLEEVRRFANAVKKHTDRLHFLINNAGIGTAHGGASRHLTADGLELHFAVNYLSGFLLTRLLRSTLIESAPARIIFVSSLGQAPIDFDDVMLARNYSGTRAYCQSKLAEVMNALDLARELEGKGVTVNSLHPATYMNTTMVREAGVTPMSTVEQGTEAILRLAMSPELEGKTGLYFDGMRPARAHGQAYRTDERARLRELSERLAGMAVKAHGRSR
jgi:NAD(P)-dependent dehydrogenase (short-subunit alcohol dehydrogenase family)